VVFDLDGVVVDSRAVVERTWRRWAERHGRDGSNIAARAHGRRSIDTVSEIAPELDVRSEVAWLADAELNDTEGLRALPGAYEALSALPDERRAVVTSGGKALAIKRLSVTGLPIPAVLVAAEEVAEGKPDPAGYLMAAGRLQIAAGRCVVIEDTPPGIEAGRAAGCAVIATATTFDAALLQAADVVVNSLGDVHVTYDGQRVHISVKLGGT
jgi:sugar-phosphatase